MNQNKNHPPQSSLFLPTNSGMAQHTYNKYNPSYNYTQRKKPHGHFTTWGKGILNKTNTSS